MLILYSSDSGNLGCIPYLLIILKGHIMSLSLSLKNYLSDLGLVAPEQLSLEFVKLLQAEHLARYSFNSLAVVLGEEVSLDVDAISQKIVTRGLGGYCFEHNKLTFELLKSVGYDVTLVMARVLNNQEHDVPRTHRVTLLTHDGVTYLIDTGFGANCPIAPLVLQPNLLQRVGSDVYRILLKESGEYDVQIMNDGDYFTLYRFDLAVYSDADCVMGNFYSSHYPKAGFVNNLVVSLKNADRTVTLKNHIMTMKHQDGTQERVLHSSKELHQVLTDVFEFDLGSVVAEHLFDRFLADKLVPLPSDDMGKRATS
jgi:N-hydroxyarylamine O-acetyltransferase